MPTGNIANSCSFNYKVNISLMQHIILFMGHLAIPLSI